MLCLLFEIYAGLPKAHNARNNLASLYIFHSHDFGKATIHLRYLHDAEPENLDYTLNLAACLAQLYRPKESLALYNAACKTEIPDLRAILGQSEIHLCLGDPDNAYKLLIQHRKTFWDSPDFLLACMNTAYAADEEDFAHEAFCKLHELYSAGGVDENTFRMIHTDEVLEMFKAHLKEAEERKKHIHTEMMKGRMPWICAAQISGNAVYWEWRMRTQKLDWIVDNPIIRASYTIYSTNGFHSQELEDSHRALQLLGCPEPGTTVVADLSALITLHRLGLLSKAADYFGEILVPQQYLETVLSDGKKLAIHQRSRRRTAEQIRHYIESGTIITIEKHVYNQSDIQIIDEYVDIETHRYRLRDLVQPVYEMGFIDYTTYQRFMKVCKKQSSIDEIHPELSQLQNIIIDFSTLETVTAFGLLDSITKFYRVHITSDAKIEIKNRLDALQIQEEVRSWHFDLWDQICSDDRFKFVHPNISQEMRDKLDKNMNLLAFWASFISQNDNLPLLCDDRVCQAMILNDVSAQ